MLAVKTRKIGFAHLLITLKQNHSLRLAKARVYLGPTNCRGTALSEVFSLLTAVVVAFERKQNLVVGIDRFITIAIPLQYKFNLRRVVVKSVVSLHYNRI